MRLALTQVKHRLGAARPKWSHAMNSFERAVYDEGAGEYEQIVPPDMMVDEPVYRVTCGANPAVITGKEGVPRGGDRFWVYDGDVSARASA